MLKLHDFKCESCDREWEDLVEPDEKSICKLCNQPGELQKLCLGKMGAFSILDEDGRRQCLLKRSADHTLKELRREPEKFGPEGINRAREGQIRSVGGLKRD